MVLENTVFQKMLLPKKNFNWKKRSVRFGDDF